MLQEDILDTLFLVRTPFPPLRSKMTLALQWQSMRYHIMPWIQRTIPMPVVSQKWFLKYESKCNPFNLQKYNKTGFKISIFPTYFYWLMMIHRCWFSLAGFQKWNHFVNVSPFLSLWDPGGPPNSQPKWSWCGAISGTICLGEYESIRIKRIMLSVGGVLITYYFWSNHSIEGEYEYRKKIKEEYVWNRTCLYCSLSGPMVRKALIDYLISSMWNVT